MTEPRLPSTADVVVVGGGLMGRSSAWRLAAAGLDVVLVVGETAAAASTVAAGMLAPVTETTFTEELLLGLNLASMRRYPTFSAEVEEASGLPSGFRAGPTISVAYDADDAARLSRARRLPDPARTRVGPADQPGGPQGRAAARPDDPRRSAGAG